MTSLVGRPDAVIAAELIAAALALLSWPRAAPTPRRPARRHLAERTRRTLVVAIGGAATALLLTAPAWAVVAGGLAGAVAGRYAGRRNPRVDPADLRDVAGMLDVIAACLDAGLSPADAIAVVAEGPAAGGPGAGARPAGSITAGSAGAAGPPGPRAARARAALQEVSGLLSLGADARAAWLPASRCTELASFAAAAQRSALGGVRLGGAARTAADDVRERCRQLGRERAAKAGVAMAGPLTVCFLPAFVCLGLAPVIIGLVSSLRIW